MMSTRSVAVVLAVTALALHAAISAGTRGSPSADTEPRPGASERDAEWEAVRRVQALQEGYPETTPDRNYVIRTWLAPLRRIADERPEDEQVQRLYLMGLNHIIYHATERGQLGFAREIEQEFDSHHPAHATSERVQHMVAARAVDALALDRVRARCADPAPRLRTLAELTRRFEESDRIRSLYLGALDGMIAAPECGEAPDAAALRARFVTAALERKGLSRTGWHLSVYLGNAGHRAVRDRDRELAALVAASLARLTRSAPELYGSRYAVFLENLAASSEFTVEDVLHRAKELAAAHTERDALLRIAR